MSRLIPMIGNSASIQNVFQLIEKIADSDSTVLITGESGTGKELIARSIHSLSHRKHESFIAINCAAIPADLLESELFGHVRGAFTGAIQNKAGRFELADGGTIFLDEIGDLAPLLQVKLLRVLQERSFEPVGGTKSIHVDVRVIAATNKNLTELVKKNLFREDLYYRLNVIPIEVPPLRERKEDIPLLLDHYIKTLNIRKNKKIQGVTDQALSALINYPWPGNIRELENLVERMVILKGEGVIDYADLPQPYRSSSSHPAEVSHAMLEPFVPHFQFPESGIDFNSVVDQFENHLLLMALEKTKWNRNQAAQLLGINRTTLVEKLKKKGLKPATSVVSQPKPQHHISSVLPDRTHQINIPQPDQNLEI
ncbi:MAG: sigma-54 dependent transcriptional regulator [Bdellovibrionaceae bacterium]|nr:sigma-54 dependent transcriptional regulator [Pseudobdellovibrionaceae bacterium]MDW8190866.1 sigma-54 dependent transcriptional regulator [Pseudobdellovibrionaceae bacterium]